MNGTDPLDYLKSRSIFDHLVEEVHFWQIVRDASGRICTWRLVYANPPTLKTWNRASLDEIVGKTTDEIFGPGATEHYRPVVEKIMAEGRAHAFQDYFPNLDRHFRFTSVPLGEHFITTGSDITDFIKEKEMLVTDNERLEQRVRERTVKLEKSVADLQRALGEIKVLQDLLPICAHCKKVRNDTGFWQQVDAYLLEHGNVKFSHGICPECAEKYYGHFLDEDEP